MTAHPVVTNMSPRARLTRARRSYLAMIDGLAVHASALDQIVPNGSHATAIFSMVTAMRGDAMLYFDGLRARLEAGEDVVIPDVRGWGPATGAG